MCIRESRIRHRLAAGICLAALAASAGPRIDPAARAALPARAGLRQVARFAHEATEVAISKTGRIFVSFPRWSEDAPISVGEVMRDGTVAPYPDAVWNAWRNTKKCALSPEGHFVCVQNVVLDNQGHLWALDPAAPAQDRVVPGGPKLVEIDLASNTVTRTIAFDTKVAAQGSYLNDVRFSPDGHYAYITDSGARGAIVAVDLRGDTARRTLDGDPTTQLEKNVVVTADGKPLRRPDGRGVEFAADGIALSHDGSTLYWQALTGTILYSVPTAALDDATLPPQALSAKVTRVGTNGVADGLLLDAAGRMYVTAPEQDAVKVRQGGTVSILVQDTRLRWPDTFAQGPDGSIYVTTSHIQDMSWFKPQNSQRLPTQLWRIAPPQ